MKINNFQGELTDISAKKEPLVFIHRTHAPYLVELTYVKPALVILFSKSNICLLDTLIQNRFLLVMEIYNCGVDVTDKSAKTTSPTITLIEAECLSNIHTIIIRATDKLGSSILQAGCVVWMKRTN